MPNAENGLGFLEVLFGYKANLGRVLGEQAECVVCGRPGFHTHVFPPAERDDVCWCDGPDCGQTPCLEAQGSTRG